MERNELFCKGQFGYRKGLSTAHALIEITELILKAFESKDFAAVTFCDLSKAFDIVIHEILLKKMHHYNIRGRELRLMRTYLDNRVQYVVTEEATSISMPVKTGVPQGSVLGPLLFLIMIHDLYDNVPTDVIHFADDTTTVTRRSERNQSLIDSQNFQTCVENWLTANGLELNKNKTNTMLFSLRELAEHEKNNLQNF